MRACVLHSTPERVQHVLADAERAVHALDYAISEQQQDDDDDEYSPVRTFPTARSIMHDS
jgi:hypothetical protein